jgi:uncharacterized repeat protein (TIGR01451 family)
MSNTNTKTSFLNSKYFKKISINSTKLLIALITIFSISLMNVPIRSFAAPVPFVVDDVADTQYNPLTSDTNGINGTTRKTLRWAIEQANRTCNPANPAIITFDYAGMKINGNLLTDANDTVTPIPSGGSGDKVGMYKLGVQDVVYRFALNSYLPDLTCPGTIIDGVKNSDNLDQIGSGNTVGYRNNKSPISTHARPFIEIMPKSNYVGQIDASAISSTTPGDKLKGIKRCGLMLRADNQEILGIAIFGFGGGQINDGNICVSSYSNGDSYAKPDFTMIGVGAGKNANVDINGYFPQVNAAGVAINNGKFIDMATAGTTEANISTAAAFDMIASNTSGVLTPIVGGDTAANLATLGVGASNFLKYPNIYTGLTKGSCNPTPDITTILNTNLVPFSGELRCATTFVSKALQNSKGVKIQFNVSGATADLKDPTGTFTTNVYDTTKAIAIRELEYHSQGSGIHIMTSDKGFVSNNILLFNGGVPGKIAPNGSQAGIVFDQAGYTNHNASTEPAQNLNAEGWLVNDNEIYMNINNDRGFGGHGVFTNLSMNGSPADPMRTQFLNNDVYQNGGAGFRTFVPSVDILGNSIYENGKHDSTPSATESTVIFNDRATKSPTFTPEVSSFKHGIYFECGDGWIFNNIIHDNPGSGVAMPGGNMQCANGGAPVKGGAVVSENSFYNNGLIAVDRFVTQATAGAPSKQFSYEKPIGSNLDTEAPGGTKFQTLNTNLGGTYSTNEVSANNMMPYPIFTHSTIDCSTKKITLNGYTFAESVVEVYKPDGATPKEQTFDGEGKDYMFDFTDENIYSDVLNKDTNSGIKEYTNDDVKDLPYLDPVSGKVILLSQAPTPVPTLDKVKAGETMKGKSAHQFSVEIPVGSALVQGDIITAIATLYPPVDPLAVNPAQEVGSSSEFSPNFKIQPINSCRDLTIDKNHGATNQDNNASPATVDQVPLNVDQTYTITVENKGPDANPVTDIVIVEDTLDAQLKLVSATGSPWTCNADVATNKLKCVLLPQDTFLLSSGKYPPISVVFKAIAETPKAVIPNTATVRRINDTKQNRTVESIPGISTFEKLFPNIIVSDPVDPTKPIAVDKFNSESDLTNNSAQEPIKVAPAPTISIRKIVTTTPNQYKVGSTITYDVIVTVSPTTTFKEVKMIDDCGASMLESCVVTTTQGTYDQATGITKALTIPASGEIKYTVTGKVKAGTTGLVKNSAKVFKDTPPDPANPNNPLPVCVADAKATDASKNSDLCDDDTVTPPVPTISIRKLVTTNPNLYTVGSTISYDVIVTVSPTTAFKVVKMIDDCGATMLESCVVTTTQGTYDQATGLTKALNIPANGEIKYTVTGKVKAGTTGDVKNNAKVDKTTPPDPTNPNNPLPECVADAKATNASGNSDLCDDDTITPPAPKAPLISIRKIVTTSPNQYTIGSTISYDVIVTVSPTTAFKEVKMIDNCGAGALESCVVTTTQGTYDQATGLTKALNIPANGEIKYTVTGKVKAGTTGNVKNNAKVDKTTPPDPSKPNDPLPVCVEDTKATNATKNSDFCDDDTVTPPVPNISIRKIVTTSPNQYTVGSTLSYDVIVTVSPTTVFKEVKMIDDCGAGALESCVVTTTQGTYDQATGLTKALTIPANGEIKYTVTGKVKAGTTTVVKNNAKVDKTTPPDPANPNNPLPECIADAKATNASGNSDLCDDDTQTPPVPNISIRKIVTTNPNQYTVGSVMTYDIVVTVSPSAIFKQVKMIDDCGAGQLENCTVFTTQGKYDPITGKATELTIPASGEIVFRVTGKVKAGTTGLLKNSAKVDKTTPPDPANPNYPLPVCVADTKATNSSKNTDPCDDDTSTPPVATISIRKIITTNPNMYAPGTILTYDIIVTVSPIATFKQVKMVDDCAAGLLEDCKVTTTQGTYDQATGMTTALTIPANGEIKYTVTGKVKASAIGIIKNIGKVDKNTPPDPAFPDAPKPICITDVKASNATGNTDLCDDDVLTPPIPPMPITPRTGGPEQGISMILLMAILLLIKSKKTNKKTL